MIISYTITIPTKRNNNYLAVPNNQVERFQMKRQINQVQPMKPIENANEHSINEAGQKQMDTRLYL